MTMVDAFILRVMYTIYIIMIVIPGSLCIECSSSLMEDIDGHGPVIKLQESYCFVNECTIRIETSNVLLNIVNNTEGWLLATNATNLFTTFVNGNMHSCSYDTKTNSYQPIDTTLYVIRMIIYSIGIIAAVANISMHLAFKELRTISGILIIILCSTISIGLAMYAVRTSTVLYYQIITQVEVCAAFIYFLVADLVTYEATKTAILAHLAYTMYKSYKLSTGEENKRSLLCRYITFIIGASMVISSTIISVDFMVNGRAFTTNEENCGTYWGNSIQLSLSNVLLVVNILIWLLVEIILAIIGALFYILTTRQCCATSISRDFRVSIILILTVDPGMVIFVVLLAMRASRAVSFSILPAATAIEQVALLALFITSSKVKCCS